MTDDEKTLRSWGIQVRKEKLSSVVAGFYVWFLDEKVFVVNGLLEEHQHQTLCSKLVAVLRLAPNLPHYVFEATAGTVASER